MYGKGFAQLIVVAICLFIVILSIAIHRKYKWTSWFLFLFAITWVWFVFFAKTGSEEQIEKMWVGTYTFLPSKSKYGMEELEKYRSCRLNVYSNNTFEVIGDFPLLINKKGRWSYREFDELDWIEYKVKGMAQFVQMGSINDDLIGVEQKIWVFTYGLRIDTGSNMLVFIK